MKAGGTPSWSIKQAGILGLIVFFACGLIIAATLAQSGGIHFIAFVIGTFASAFIGIVVSGAIAFTPRIRLLFWLMLGGIVCLLGSFALEILVSLATGFDMEAYFQSLLGLGVLKSAVIAGAMAFAASGVGGWIVAIHRHASGKQP